MTDEKQKQFSSGLYRVKEAKKKFRKADKALTAAAAALSEARTELELANHALEALVHEETEPLTI